MSVMMPEKTEDGLEELWDEDIICTIIIDNTPCPRVAAWWHIGRCPAEGRVFRSPACDPCKEYWLSLENAGMHNWCAHCGADAPNAEWEKM